MERVEDVLVRLGARIARVAEIVAVGVGVRAAGQLGAQVARIAAAIAVLVVLVRVLDRGAVVHNVADTVAVGVDGGRIARERVGLRRRVRRPTVPTATGDQNDARTDEESHRRERNTLSSVRVRVAVLAILLAATAACGLPEGDYFGRIDKRVPGTFRWCNGGEPDHLDPVLASSQVSSPLVSALFDGLATYGMDGLPVPSLATHWEISDDLRTFTFHLRDDARWTNGRAVTAYDVAYSAIRVVTPSTASPNADNIAPLRNAPGYLARTVYELGAGDEIVELVGDAEPPDLAARTSSHELALRDLGGGAPYARVPAGSVVELIATTGLRDTWPSPAALPGLVGDDGQQRGPGRAPLGVVQVTRAAQPTR